MYFCCTILHFLFVINLCFFQNKAVTSGESISTPETEGVQRTAGEESDQILPDEEISIGGNVTTNTSAVSPRCLNCVVQGVRNVLFGPPPSTRFVVVPAPAPAPGCPYQACQCPPPILQRCPPPPPSYRQERACPEPPPPESQCICPEPYYG